MKRDEKLVPKRRFREFENNGDWELDNLDNGAFKIGDGLHGTPRYTDNGNVYFINGNNLITGTICFTNETKKVTENEQSKDDKALDSNTILMSINGTIGNLAWYNGEKVMLGKSVAYIKLKSYDKTYIYAYLQTSKIYNYFIENLTGSTIKNLGLKTIRDTKVAIPQMKEQKSIGSFFLKIDNLITLNQRKLKKIRDLKSAYLSDMFPKEGEKYPKIRFEGFSDAWIKRDVNFLANRFDNLRVPITAADRVPGTTPYYGANGIQDYVKGFTHNGEYILIAEDGANDLKDYPVHYVNGKVWVNNHAHVLQAKQGVSDNKFLMYAFKVLDIQPYLVGGGRAKLNANVMMGLTFKVTSIDEQIKISNFLFKLDKIITLQETRLYKLQNLKKAYLNEMFV